MCLPECKVKSSSTAFPLLRHRADLMWAVKDLCVLVLESFMAPSQLVEKLLIERVALLTTACRHENVASDELVNDFAVGGYAAESDVDVAFKLYGHLEESETHTMYMRLFQDES